MGTAVLLHGFGLDVRLDRLAGILPDTPTADEWDAPARAAGGGRERAEATPMGLFTIEAEGRPVMVVAAEDWEEAREFADSEALRADLLVLEHQGCPLWGGERELLVREAHPGEVSAWEASFARACADGDADEEDREDWATFLVEVVDPAGDADGDDEGERG